MKNILGILAISVSFLFAKDRTYGNMRVNKIIEVIDGDTFLAQLSPSYPRIIGDTISIRVYGIDAPETHSKDTTIKKAGKLARDFAEKQLRGAKKVSLTQVRRDKYFRILAVVKCDTLDLGAAMVRSKMAKPYFGGTKVP